MSVVVFKASSRYRSRWRTIGPAPYPSSNDPSKKEDSRIETGAFDVSPVDERRGWRLSRERSDPLRGLVDQPMGEIVVGGTDCDSELIEVFLWGGPEVTETRSPICRAARAASSSGIE
jgi:hypothetical protein